jgi:AcrR family transcriptional regulator
MKTRTRTRLRDRTGPSGRERILQCAADLFLQNGYAGTSVRDIADAAGIKAASLYYHFDSKDDLLGEILRRGVQATSDAFDETTLRTESGLEGGDVLRAAIHSHLSALFEHGPFTSVAVVVFPLAPPEVKVTVVPARDAYEARWQELFDNLAARNELNPSADRALARLVLLGALNSTLEWFDPDGNLSVHDLADSIADTFWQGLKP